MSINDDLNLIIIYIYIVYYYEAFYDKLNVAVRIPAIYCIYIYIYMYVLYIYIEYVNIIYYREVRTKVYYGISLRTIISMLQ